MIASRQRVIYAPFVFLYNASVLRRHRSDGKSFRAVRRTGQLTKRPTSPVLCTVISLFVFGIDRRARRMKRLSLLSQHATISLHQGHFCGAKRSWLCRWCVSVVARAAYYHYNGFTTLYRPRSHVDDPATRYTLFCVSWKSLSATGVLLLLVVRGPVGSHWLRVPSI